MRNITFSVVFGAALLLGGCSSGNLTDRMAFEQLTYEQVDFIFPAWPEALPPLLFWEVELYAPQDGIRFNSKYTADSKGFSYRVKKNCPLYVKAVPVTQPASAQESPLYFFKAAGTVYPWQYPGSLSWCGGYAASLMQTLINAAEASGYRGEYVGNYIASFNWARLITTLEQKQQEGLEEGVFYNPWLLDSQEVLEGIAYESFTATKLRNSGVFSVTLDFPVYSSYVPENEFSNPLQSTQQTRISIKKNVLALFALRQTAQDFGILIYGSSEKNMSLEFISMPIYIEGI